MKCIRFSTFSICPCQVAPVVAETHSVLSLGRNETISALFGEALVVDVPCLELLLVSVGFKEVLEIRRGSTLYNCGCGFEKDH